MLELADRHGLGPCAHYERAGSTPVPGTRVEIITMIKYSFLKILTGSDLSQRKLALMSLAAPRPGPTVWLTAAVHGDEVGGIVVIQEIFKKLKQEPLLKGELFAFPLMNPIGFESAMRSIPISKEDLNRSFPGNPSGSLAERIANTIFQAIIKTKPHLVLDLHNDWLNSIPYTPIDPHPGSKFAKTYEAVLKFARLAGLVIVDEEGESEQSRLELAKTLSGTLVNLGVPALSLELGEDSVVNEKNVQVGISAVWNILHSLGMVSATLPDGTHVPQALKGKVLRYSMQISSKSGLIRFLVNPGEIVKSGQPVARIYNVLGKPRETIKAKREAIVLGLTDSAVALPGGQVAAFGIIN